MDSTSLTAAPIGDEDAVVRRLDADIRALAESRRSCASTTREHFARGSALEGQGLKTRYLELVVDRHRMHNSAKSDEAETTRHCLELVGLVETHFPPWDEEARRYGYALTPLAQALLPILQHEGLTSPFVWYVLWIHLSSAWLGALSWNMLSRAGVALPLLVEPLCSYLCGDDRLDSRDRGAASSLEESFRGTPWGELGIGVAPAYGRRLWSRAKPDKVDPLVLLYGLYACTDVSGVLTIDEQQLISLPYGPCTTLNLDGDMVMRQLLSLWVPGLLTQRRNGGRITLSVQPARSTTDVVLEYVRRRGYQ